MKLFENITHIYFLGIGGIGMSALARYFSLQGKTVAGYDKTPTEITKALQNEGVKISYADEISEISAGFKDKNHTLVVYTPAVSRENRLYQFYDQGEFLIKKRAEILGMITSGFQTLAVAGTHGKTTTTAILAHILKQSGVNITAFLGGISENYHTNFICDGNEAIVVEADEFDRSFLQLSPNIAAITSIDADHLDVYKNEKALHESFQAFAKKIPQEENLVYKKGLPLKGKTIAVNDSEADYYIHEVQVEQGTYTFSFTTPQETLTGIQFSLPGHHNLLNAGMALVLAEKFGIPLNKLTPHLASFKGVERRFTYHLNTDQHVLIEDYAHHPQEIIAVHQAISEMHARKKTLAVFQPHLYSRTQDFATAFAESLSKFDEVILLDIYPAREEPIEGVNSEMLLKKIAQPHKKLVAREDLVEEVKKSGADVIVILGAGDITNEVKKIKVALNHES